MQNSDTRQWLALHSNPQLSAAVLRKLTRIVSTPEQLFSLSIAQLHDGGIPLAAQQALKVVAKQIKSPQLEKNWHYLQQQQVKILPLNSSCYPE